MCFLNLFFWLILSFPLLARYGTDDDSRLFVAEVDDDDDDDEEEEEEELLALAGESVFFE